jgi:hypothetical protein
MAMFGPSWWHHHGIKMRLSNLSKLEEGLLVIETGSCARLKVEKHEHMDGHFWLVHWTIDFSLIESVKGEIAMSDDTLASAFGLLEIKPEYSWMTKRFMAESCKQGKFIRVENYVNIPGPGTGHDGDPNISIFLDQEMKDAVEKMIGIFGYRASKSAQLVESERP